MDECLGVAEAVREACLRRAVRAYEDAGLSGLCAEGRWDVAVDAVRRLDLSELLREPQRIASAADGKLPDPHR